MLKLSSEDTLLLLTCRSYLDADAEASLRQVLLQKLDWSYLVWRAESYRIVPQLYHHLQRLNLQDGIPNEIKIYLEGWSLLSKTRSVEQFRQLGMVLDAFGDAGIECFLLKGAPLAAVYSPNPLIRPMQDVDIVIHPKDVWRAKAQMFRLGFRHGVWNPSTARFTEMNRRITPALLKHHYELPSFTKVVTLESPLPAEMIPWSWRKQHIKCYVDAEGTLTLPIFIDVHFNLSAGIEEEDVWRGVSNEIVLGKQVNVQSATGMIWFLAARVYNEAFQFNTLKLGMLGDIHSVLHVRPEAVDWAEVILIGHKYGFHPALFYVLSQIKNIMGIPIPENVLEKLRPERKSVPPANDYGDIVPKLLSIPAVHEIRLA